MQKCKDIIESKHVHDFKWCSCKSIAVDGGLEYLRRVGNLEDVVQMYRDINAFSLINSMKKWDLNYV